MLSENNRRDIAAATEHPTIRGTATTEKDLPFSDKADEAHSERKDIAFQFRDLTDFQQKDFRYAL